MTDTRIEALEELLLSSGCVKTEYGDIEWTQSDDLSKYVSGEAEKKRQTIQKNLVYIAKKDDNNVIESFTTGLQLTTDGLTLVSYNAISSFIKNWSLQYGISQLSTNPNHDQETLKEFAVIDQNKKENPIDFSFVYAYPTRDIALIKMKTDFDVSFPTGVVLEAYFPTITDEVINYGIGDSAGIIFQCSGLVQTKELEKVENSFYGRAVEKAFLTSSPMATGMVGGPVVGTNGNIHGITLGQVYDFEQEVDVEGIKLNARGDATVTASSASIINMVLGLYREAKEDPKVFENYKMCY